MATEAARLRVKTAIFVAIVVLSNAFGDFFMKRGMPAESKLVGPLDYVSALFEPWVAAGVILLIVWQMSRLALLSWADLSYVLPVTSVGYVVVALLGRVLLHEEISVQNWAGIVLIMGGVALVSAGTTPQTTDRHPPSNEAPQ